VFHVKIGIIIQSNDPETVWNAVRFANTSLNSNHVVKIFLLGKGVELEQIKSDRFDVQSVIHSFLERKGELQACGTCLESRNSKSAICPASNMNNLLRIVEESDKVLVF
jgi:sulfur relay (sulfurtransferase) complex TusBCD TusD component (DsrE family)